MIRVARAAFGRTRRNAPTLDDGSPATPRRRKWPDHDDDLVPEVRWVSAPGVVPIGLAMAAGASVSVAVSPASQDWGPTPN